LSLNGKIQEIVENRLFLSVQSTMFRDTLLTSFG